MAVVRAAAVLPSGAVRAPPIPVQYSSVLLSCRALFFVGCVVQVVSICSRSSSCGGSSVHPPLAVWRVGPLWMVGWHDEVGGVVSEGAAVLPTPVDCQCPLLFVLVSPSCWLSGRVEWRGGACYVVPVLGLGLAPSCCLAPLVSSSLLFRFVCGGMMQCEMGCVMCVMNGGCVVRGAWYRVPFCSSSSLHCVCCYSIVGLVVCLCDRVVLLWNGGGWFMRCLSTTHVVVCASA